MRSFKAILITSFLFFISVSAHVNLIQPSGGETFVAGTTLHIEWRQAVHHGEGFWELYFSADGGTTWTVIINNLHINENDSIRSYDWQLPDSEVTNEGHIRVIQNNAMGRDYVSTSMSFIITLATSLNDYDKPSAGSFILNDAYPNPFNAGTIISFRLQKPSSVVINIFDIAGRKIEDLLHKQLAAGEHHIRWNLTNLPSGVYFYSVENGSNLQTRRLFYIK